MAKRWLFSSESVTEGHPDKVCDQISDAVLDEFLRQDLDSRVAVEAMITSGVVFVAGEVTSKGKADVQKIVRDTIRTIGYDRPEYGFDCDSCSVLASLHEQSPDISMGVNASASKDQGAGDQGLMFGFATNETPELMPLPITLAHRLSMSLAGVRKKKELGWVRPDGKSQVSVVYEDRVPKRVDSIVISTQHSPDINMNQLREEVINKVIKPVCDRWIDNQTKFLVNPTGRFVIGGPPSDTGLTGRKIIVDTYGGMARHGGGAFYGKDPSKVDRSGAYAMRWVAKNVVAAGLARRCEVQVAYAIGAAHPVGLFVECFGTETVPVDRIQDAITSVFDLRPGAIVRDLDLLRPIYAQTAAYGHFGRELPDFTWEKTDRADALKAAAGV